MARGRKKPPKGAPKRQSRKDRKKAKCDDCPTLDPGKTPKKPFLERGESKGLVDLKFPGFEAKFPGTNRSVMVILCTLICALVIMVPTCFYLVFSADPEALQEVGEFFGEEKPREPVKMPVQTDNGIEIIEVCPPCQDWSHEECEERYGACECPACNCPQCPTCPAPAVMAPLPGGKGDPLL